MPYHFVFWNCFFTIQGWNYEESKFPQWIFPSSIPPTWKAKNQGSWWHQVSLVQEVLHLAHHRPKTFCNYCKKFGHIPECTRQPQHLNLHVYHAEISTSATTGASFPLCMSASSTSDLTPKVVQYIVGLSTKLQLYPFTSFRFWGIWYMCWVPQQFSSFHLKFMQWIESHLILLVWMVLSFVTQAIHWHKKKSPAYTTIC